MCQTRLKWNAWIGAGCFIILLLCALSVIWIVLHNPTDYSYTWRYNSHTTVTGIVGADGTLIFTHIAVRDRRGQPLLADAGIKLYIGENEQDLSTITPEIAMDIGARCSVDSGEWLTLTDRTGAQVAFLFDLSNRIQSLTIDVYDQHAQLSDARLSFEGSRQLQLPATEQVVIGVLGSPVERRKTRIWK